MCNAILSKNYTHDLLNPWQDAISPASSGIGGRRNLHHFIFFFFTIQEKKHGHHITKCTCQILLLLLIDKMLLFYSPTKNNWVTFSTNIQKGNIKQLLLRSKVIHKWQIEIHISQTVLSLLTIQAFFRSLLQKKGLKFILPLYHITTT